MKYFFSIVLSCISLVTLAQKAQNVYFLTKDGKEVSTIDSADFTRIVKEPDAGQVNFELFEYHKNKSLKRVGYISAFHPKIILEGFIREFYSNGSKKEISNYIRNVKTGESTLFFENGFVEMKMIYSKPPDKTGTFINQYTDFSNNDVIVKYLGDSLGNALLDTNGTGTFKTVYKDGGKVSGSYLNGLKNGIWESSSADDEAVTKDFYENAKFVKGIRTEKSGLITEYAQQEVLPEFPGGMTGFGKYIQRTFHYSAEAQRQGVSGKVILSFVIEKDGAVTDIKILRDIGLGTGSEAKRILANSPRWIPGLQNEKPVKVAYTLPIDLRLEVEVQYGPNRF